MGVGSPWPTLAGQREPSRGSPPHPWREAVHGDIEAPIRVVTHPLPDFFTDESGAVLAVEEYLVDTAAWVCGVEVNHGCLPR